MFTKSEIKPFYTTRDVAQLLNVSEDTVREFNKYGYRGFPKGFKVVNKWRWERNKIDNWVESIVFAQTQPANSTLANFAPDMYKLLNELLVNENVHNVVKISTLLSNIDKRRHNYGV